MPYSNNAVRMKGCMLRVFYKSNFSAQVAGGQAKTMPLFQLFLYHYSVFASPKCEAPPRRHFLSSVNFCESFGRMPKYSYSCVYLFFPLLFGFSFAICYNTCTQCVGEVSEIWCRVPTRQTEGTPYEKLSSIK